MLCCIFPAPPCIASQQPINCNGTTVTYDFGILYCICLDIWFVKVGSFNETTSSTYFGRGKYSGGWGNLCYPKKRFYSTLFKTNLHVVNNG